MTSLSHRRGEGPRAHQAGQLDGIATVRFDPSPGLFGDQRGRDDPASMAFFRPIAVESVPAGACRRDKDEMWTFGLPLPDELSDVTRSCTAVAEGDDFCVIFRRDVVNGNRRLMDIHSDGKRARLVQG